MATLDWNYQETKQEFETIPAGNYRARIENVEKGKSASGRDMLTITYKISGYASTVRDYIVFLPEHPDITNKKLTQLFDSFCIEEKAINILEFWKGHTGAVCIKVEQYDGKDRAKVNYCIPANKQDLLPAWVEKGAVVSEATKAAVDISEDMLPF